MKLIKNKVWHIQRRLKDHYGKSITVDGKWGPATLAAALNVCGGPVPGLDDTRSLQDQLRRMYDASLSVDGKVGPKTLNALLTVLGGPVELESVFAKAAKLVLGQTQRKITKLILHCSATPEGVDFTVEDINNWHRARGFSYGPGGYVGYHYIIYLDGTIVQGRPETRVGAHAYPWNTGSIGVCYIGGVGKDGQPKDTRTPEQLKAMEELAIQLDAIYNFQTVVGHRQVPGVRKACPSFDVTSWWKSIKEKNV